MEVSIFLDFGAMVVLKLPKMNCRILFMYLVGYCIPLVINMDENTSVLTRYSYGCTHSRIFPSLSTELFIRMQRYSIVFRFR